MCKQTTSCSCRTGGKQTRRVVWGELLRGMRRVAGGVAVAGLAGSMTLAAQDASYKAGQTAYAARQYARAAELFARAAAAEGVAAASTHSDALLLEARSLLNLARTPEAEAAVRQYLREEPRSAPALYLLGHVQQAENKPKESLGSFTAAAALQVPAGEDLRAVALDYVLLDDYTDALQWSGQAVAMDPKNAEAWYDLGRVQMHEGRFPEAIRALQASLAERPGNAKALDNLGVCLENENRPDEALKAYADAVKATAATTLPQAQPYVDEGKLLVTRNAFAEAETLLRRATELAANDAVAFAALAAAETGLGRTAEARTAMERAVALNPSNPRLHYQLARIYRAAGEAALADAEFKKSAALYGGRSSE